MSCDVTCARRDSIAFLAPVTYKSALGDVEVEIEVNTRVEVDDVSVRVCAFVIDGGKRKILIDAKVAIAIFACLSL